jgi:WD40 repeat protein
LVTAVFPEFCERLELLGLEFYDVDLRWGVPEAGVDGEIANPWAYCKKWIDQVRPFFVCMLGQRYGYRPSHGHGDSITEMEIRYAAGVQPIRKRCFFYLRDTRVPAGLPPEARALFADSDSKPINGLRDWIVNHSGRPVRHYACRWTGHGFDRMDTFGRMVLEDLWSGVLRDPRYVPPAAWIRAGCDPENNPVYRDEHTPIPESLWRSIVQFAKPDALDAFAEERRQMEAFSDSKLRYFQGRKAELAALMEFVRGGESSAPRVAVVQGRPGMGKTALLAALAHELTNSPEEVITHFVGATGSSTDLRQVLLRLNKELDRVGVSVTETRPSASASSRFLGNAISIGDSSSRDSDSMSVEDLGLRLESRLYSHRGGKIVIVIDAINQITGIRDASWLPSRLASTVRIVVSTVVPGQATDNVLIRALQGRRPKPVFIDVNRLEDTSVRAIVCAYLNDRCKDPQSIPVDAIAAMPQAKNPLYLLVMLHELCTLGGDNMQAKVPALVREMGRWYPDTVALFDWVLERLEVFGRDRVAHWCICLALSRKGMSGRELSEFAAFHELVPDPAPRLSRRQLDDICKKRESRDAIQAAHRIERGIRPWSLRRGHQIDFCHSELRQAVTNRYLSLLVHEDFRRHHLEIARCLETGTEGTAPNLHAVEELPYHLAMAEDSKTLEDTLTDLDFMHVKCRSDMLYGLLEDYRLAYQHCPSQSELLADCQRFISEQSALILRKEEPFLQLVANRGGPSLRSAARLLQTSRGQRGLSLLNERIVRRWSGVVEGHRGQVNDVAVTPDGSVFVSASEDCTLRVWDAATGKHLRTLFGHEDWVRCVATHPDPTTVLSGSYDGTIRRWDVNTGVVLGVFSGHKDTVWDLAASPDGRCAVSISDDQSMRKWDLSSQACVKTVPGHFGSIEFSPDGRFIARGGLQGNVELLDAHTLQPLAVLLGHNHGVLGLSFSSDGLLASACEDKTVRIWDLKSKSCLLMLEGHHMIVQNAAISPDVRLCVSTSNDQTVRVWDLASGKCREVLRGHSDWVRGVAFLAGGRLVTSSGDCTLRIWHIDNMST